MTVNAAVRSPWIIAFGLVSVLHLVLNAADVQPGDSISKGLIAPLLAAWVVQQRGPQLLVAALVFSWAGDVVIEKDELFVGGMAAFAAAHVCWITFFVQRGALGAFRTKPWLPAIYLAGGIALVAWVWTGLEADVRPVVPIYALLLAGTAATSMSLDVRAGLGGLAFYLSDGLIAATQAGRVDDGIPADTAIMILYILALFLLSAGILDRELRTRRIAGEGFDPTQRTDCWPAIPPARTR